MHVLTTRQAWRDLLGSWRRDGDRIGLCPTMGALHAGHLRLVSEARASCDRVAVTIFVNPTQFTASSDLTAYPRPLETDLALLRDVGVDAVFVPDVNEIYPNFPDPAEISVVAGALGERFEGRDRPGHFAGVATVVAILLNLTQAHAVFFGEKDFQQLAIVTATVRDLAIATEIIGVPIVREPDGLAMSSRNARLSPQGRLDALVISQALRDAQQAASAGADADRVRGVMHERLASCDAFELAYAELVDPQSLVPLCSNVVQGYYRALVAGVIEGVRLLDNAEVSFPTL